MKPTIEQLRALPDWASRYRWNLIFNSFPSGITISFATPSTDRLNFQCVSASLPKKTGGTFPVSLRGWTLINPGIWVTSGTIILTFIETVDSLVLNFLQGWHEAAWAMKTGQAATKKGLTANIILNRLDRFDSIVRQYRMDVIIADYDSGGDLDDASPDTRPTITLAYDSFTEETATGF